MTQEDDELTRKIVETANASQITDTKGLERAFHEHDVVFGVWQDPLSQTGVDQMIMKGEGQLMLIAQGQKSHEMKITAVPCRNAEEAEAMRLTYGDGRSER